MPQQTLTPSLSGRYVDGDAAAEPVIFAAAKRVTRSLREAIAAVGSLIWGACAYRRAFNRAAAHVADDPFDSPVLWADISARARDQARLSSGRAGDRRLLATGAGALIGAFAFCAAVGWILT